MHGIIKKLLKLKKLFINFSFRSAANFISKLIGIITLPIITRALGPESYGNYYLILMIVRYTSLPIGLLGLRSYGIREIAGGKKENSYANNILSMQLTIAIIAIFIGSIIIYIIFKFNTFLLVSIFIGYLIVFSNALDLEFFFVAKKDLVFPTIAHFIGQFFFVIGVIFFINKPNDLPILVFLAALTPMISNLIQIKKFNNNFGKFKLKLNLNETMDTFKTTYKLGLSTNLEYFYPSIPQLLIPVFLGSYALGIFAGGYKIFSLLALFFGTLFYALAPYLIKLNEYPLYIKRKYHLLLFLVLFFFSSIIGLGLYFFGELLIQLILGKNFGESTLIFKVISLTLIPLVPVNMLFANILIYSNREKYYLLSLVFGLFIVLVSSPVLLNEYSTVGVVYALAISRIFCIGIMIYFYFKSEYQNKYEKET